MPKKGNARLPAEAELITTRQAGKLLGVGPDAVKAYIRGGAIRAIKLPSGHWRVLKRDVEALLAPVK